MAYILIVDDSEFIRKKIKSIAEEVGVSKIDGASNGEEAIEMARKNNYDLIFMDIMMPSLNGLDAIKNIKSSNHNTIFVVCTSINQQEVIEDFVRAGANEFIAKPFEDKDIELVLRKYLRLNS